MAVELITGPFDVGQLRNTMNELINQFNAYVQASGGGNVSNSGSGTQGNIPVFGSTPTTITDSGIAPGNAQASQVSATNQSSAFTLTIPAKAYIQAIVVHETAGHDLDAYLMVGTTLGGFDVMNGFTTAANSFQVTPPSQPGALAEAVFSTSVPTTLYFDANTSFNGAHLNVTVFYGLLP